MSVSTFCQEPMLFQKACVYMHYVPQLLAVRDLTDELPTKICISNY